MELEIFSFHEWRPLARFGFTHPFWTINADTVLCSWLAMALLVCACVAIRWSLRERPHSMPSFIITYSTRALMNFATEALGSFDALCFTYALSLFLFSFFCTIASLIPNVEEATHDANTTFALSIMSFLFVQFQGFKAHGLAHLKEYTQPFFFMAPMHIVGDLAKITSMSFRLFGNILAGSVILQIMFLPLAHLFPYISMYLIGVGALIVLAHFLTKLNPTYKSLERRLPLLYAIFFIPAGVQFFFGLFEGLIQSFIIALLTLTYTGLITNTSHEEA